MGFVRSRPGARSRRQLLDAGLIPLDQMAEQLGVSTGTVKIWHHAGIASGSGTTWVPQIGLASETRNTRSAWENASANGEAACI
jgi:hypothetical protein